jgi:hypothetical protein
MFYPKLAMFLWICGTLNKYDDDEDEPLCMYVFGFSNLRGVSEN